MKNKKNKGHFSSVLSALLILIIISITMTTGCSDSNVAGIQSAGNKITSSDETPQVKGVDSTLIRLNMNLSFKSSKIVDNKFLESNLGNHFNHIAEVQVKLTPGEELDLQDLQPYGIFGLYLSASGMFTITNSDALSLTTKTLLLEKCAFIDLKIKNTDSKPIEVSGFVAGE